MHRSLGIISPYRAGFLPKERREIGHRLFSGDLLGVISTSALELGVDIGGLDCCILCGYPGSVASTWQRAGRVGRHGQESMIAMIAIQDALDQYFMRHPGAFFEKSHEAAVIDPENRNSLKRHIPYASSEVYLREDDGVYNDKYGLYKQTLFNSMNLLKTSLLAIFTKIFLKPSVRSYIPLFAGH